MSNLLLVDTSVWIDYFRNVENAHTEYLSRHLDSGIVCTCDVVLLEVLRGFDADRDFDKAKRFLTALPMYETGGKEMALRAVSLYRALRRRAITIRSSIDCLIATVAIDNEMPLLANDRDYLPFAKYMNLSLPVGG